MNQLNILNEAKKVKSIEELKHIAIDNNITLTDEEAKFYFSMLEEKKGELSMDDLDAATGGNIAFSSICNDCGYVMAGNAMRCGKCYSENIRVLPPSC